MSRSGYTDDCDDPLALGRWRGCVASAMRGKRGQAFLIELRDALDAMPVKRLASGSFQSADGDFCTLGVIGNSRGTLMTDLEPEGGFADWDACDGDLVGERFGIAAAMALEIMFMNDEWCYLEESPERRWQRMRQWVDEQIRPQEPDIKADMG